MAFDGITIAAMVQELHKYLDGGRFNKIAQPESDAASDHGKRRSGTVQTAFVCKRLSSADLFY